MSAISLGFYSSLKSGDVKVPSLPKQFLLEVSEAELDTLPLSNTILSIPHSPWGFHRALSGLHFPLSISPLRADMIFSFSGSSEIPQGPSIENEQVVDGQANASKSYLKESFQVIVCVKSLNPTEY